MLHRCFELLMLLAGAVVHALPKIGCVNTVTLGFQPSPWSSGSGLANCTLLANAINDRNVTGVELRCIDFMGYLDLMVDGLDNSHLVANSLNAIGWPGITGVGAGGDSKDGLWTLTVRGGPNDFGAKCESVTAAMNAWLASPLPPPSPPPPVVVKVGCSGDHDHFLTALDNTVGSCNAIVKAIELKNISGLQTCSCNNCCDAYHRQYTGRCGCGISCNSLGNLILQCEDCHPCQGACPCHSDVPNGLAGVGVTGIGLMSTPTGGEPHRTTHLTGGLSDFSASSEYSTVTSTDAECNFTATLFTAWATGLPLPPRPSEWTKLTCLPYHAGNYNYLQVADETQASCNVVTAAINTKKVPGVTGQVSCNSGRLHATEANCTSVTEALNGIDGVAGIGCSDLYAGYYALTVPTDSGCASTTTALDVWLSRPPPPPPSKMPTVACAAGDGGSYSYLEAADGTEISCFIISAAMSRKNVPGVTGVTCTSLAHLVVAGQQPCLSVANALNEMGVAGIEGIGCSDVGDGYSGLTVMGASECSSAAAGLNAWLSSTLPPSPPPITTTTHGNTCNSGGCIPKGTKKKDGQQLCCTQGHETLECPGPAHYRCG